MAPRQERREYSGILSSMESVGVIRIQIMSVHHNFGVVVRLGGVYRRDSAFRHCYGITQFTRGISAVTMCQLQISRSSRIY